ncbi:MAG: hypothetical protein RL748_1897 [Pseudomonadota bacterium]|jgi:uncharacterized protein (DUF1778 family)
MNVIEERGRITARVSQPIVDKLQQAADLTGATMNQFLVQAALEKAESILERERSIQLSQQDALMLIKLLENPVPNPALSSAMQRYQEKIKNGTVHSSAESGA